MPVKIWITVTAMDTMNVFTSIWVIGTAFNA